MPEGESPEYRNPESDAIEVDQDDGWKKAEHGEIIETTGLGPCVGIIFYDPESKKAIVGHFADPRDDKSFFAMLVEVKSYFTHPEKLQIHIAGGAPVSTSDRSIQEAKNTRRMVQETLKNQGFENVTAKYQTSSESTILRIDTSEGKIEYEDEIHDEGY